MLKNNYSLNNYSYFLYFVNFIMLSVLVNSMSYHECPINTNGNFTENFKNYIKEYNLNNTQSVFTNGTLWYNSIGGLWIQFDLMDDRITSSCECCNKYYKYYDAHATKGIYVQLCINGPCKTECRDKIGHYFKLGYYYYNNSGRFFYKEYIFVRMNELINEGCYFYSIYLLNFDLTIGL